MNCPKCKTKMQRVNGNYHFKECGLKNVWLQDWPMVKCPECDEARPVMPNPDLIQNALVERLATQEKRLDGDSILFLRKVMGLTAAQLGDVLGLNRVQVSKLENNRATISEVADLRLRAQAAELLPAQSAAKVRASILEELGKAAVASAAAAASAAYGSINITQHEYRELELV
jgi:transcriptional regulator with XRE-family HTH domain